MKKTTKKLSINKETVVSFEILSSREAIAVNGGTDTHPTWEVTRPSGCYTCETACGLACHQVEQL